MANDKFSISDAIKYGWETFKTNVPFFLGFVVVVCLISMLPSYLAEKIFAPKSLMLTLAKIVLQVVGLIIGMISTRIALDIHDSGQPDLSRISEIIPQIPSYVGGKILYFLILLIGFVLLIVPGVILYYMFFFVGYLIVDRHLGPIEALRESKAVTDGYKMDLFLFSWAIVFLNLLGAVCLVVGLLVTVPISMMASAYVYRRLSPAEPSAETA